MNSNTGMSILTGQEIIKEVFNDLETEKYLMHMIAKKNNQLG